MPTFVQIALAVIGSLAGIAYAGLGVAALKHLPNADSSDRVFDWSLWWFVEPSRYTAQGQALVARADLHLVWLLSLGWRGLQYNGSEHVECPPAAYLAGCAFNWAQSPGRHRDGCLPVAPQARSVQPRHLTLPSRRRLTDEHSFA